MGGLTGSGSVTDCYVDAENFSAGATGLLTGDGSVSTSYFYGPRNGQTLAGNGGAVTASYYLGGSDSGESKTAEQFSSGEVTWLMQTQNGTSFAEHRSGWTQGSDRPCGARVPCTASARSSPENGSILLNGVGTVRTFGGRPDRRGRRDHPLCAAGESVRVEVIPFEDVEIEEKVKVKNEDGERVVKPQVTTITYELQDVWATADATGETQSSWTRSVYSFSSTFGQRGQR